MPTCAMMNVTSASGVVPSPAFPPNTTGWLPTSVTTRVMKNEIGASRNAMMPKTAAYVARRSSSSIELRSTK